MTTSPLGLRIRRACPDDRACMLEVWERAVRATHDFLSEAAVGELRPAVVDVLASDALQWWVCDGGDGIARDRIAGFLGVVDDSVEALFVDPTHHRRGVGRLFIDHAQHLNNGSALRVDVNEDNRGALRFYQHLGFDVVGRSDRDADGRPYPLLHLRRDAPTSKRDPI